MKARQEVLKELLAMMKAKMKDDSLEESVEAEEQEPEPVEEPEEKEELGSKTLADLFPDLEKKKTKLAVADSAKPKRIMSLAMLVSKCSPKAEAEPIKKKK